jgi:hypothetical protein
MKSKAKTTLGIATLFSGIAVLDTINQHNEMMLVFWGLSAIAFYFFITGKEKGI